MLNGKTAIVTGGAKGIGLAIAKELSREGVDLVVCSRTESRVKEALGELTKDGKKAYGTTADVSKFEDCQKLVNFALSQTGRIDILVNNAGTYGPVGFLETNDPKEWEQVLSTNLLGAVYCSKLVIPYLKKQGSGKIVNLAGAGVGGSKPLPRFSGYYVSKAAIVALTENLGAELRDDKIQVNAIAPGGVASDLNLDLLKLDKSIIGEEMFKMVTELKEKGGTSPELAAKLVAFLVSDKANHITGRLLSAKWDPIETLAKPEGFTENLYRLRRVDNSTILEKNND